MRGCEPGPSIRNILAVGGGNGAVEAALTLSEQNRVSLSYRGNTFSRIFKDNERKLNQAIQARQVKPLLNSTVTEFGEREVKLKIRESGSEQEWQVPYDHAFVLIGADVPRRFLKSLGLRMENEWEGSLPVTLYPFLGGKIWCRYWCPLAKLMQLQSQLFSKLKWSRFKIVANV